MLGLGRFVTPRLIGNINMHVIRGLLPSDRKATTGILHI